MSRRLKLSKPLAILDLETTGTTTSQDRIVEIAILTIEPDGKETPYRTLVNPGIPIPPEATKVHGIDDDDVKDCPTFNELAVKLYQILEESDLAGFNLIRFDLPMLQTEFARTKVKFSLENRRIIDACHIFHKKEPRDLAAALKFFCDEEHTEAHSAMTDVRACWKVLAAQVSRYKDLSLDLQERKFDWRHNEATFAFGKHRGSSLKDIAKREPDFLAWMLRSDFEPETKAIVEKALTGKFPKRELNSNA
jgi:DNA polymerase-3 subunit epsilon